MSQGLPVFNGLNAPEIRPIPWIIQGFLARGAGTILFGQPGVSKTAHTAILCASLWSGSDFGIFPILETGLKVLYVDLDGGWDWTAPLFRAAFRGVGLEGLPKDFYYYSPLTPECFDVNPETGERKETSLVTLEERGSQIAATVKQYQIDLVVVDSLGQFMVGDSNSGQDVSLALRMGLNPARAAGAAVLIIDHATKAARQVGQSVPTPAGSQQKRAWARCTVALEEEDCGGERATRWTVDKSNAAHFAPFLTKLHFQNSGSGELETLTLELIGDAGERNKPAEIGLGGALAAQADILRILSNKPDGIARRKEFTRNGTYEKVLNAMVESGELTNPHRGVYQVCTIAPTPRDVETVQTTIQAVNNDLDNCTTPTLVVQSLVQTEKTLENLHQTAPLRTTEKTKRTQQVNSIAPLRTTEKEVTYDV
jgi:hypothetical protein